MANYRKLVAALVGLALLLLKRWTGIEVPGLADLLVEMAMSAGTAVAVWALPNSPSTRPDPFGAA